MATINASTKISVPKKRAPTTKAVGIGMGNRKKAAAPRGQAPPLKPSALASADAQAALQAADRAAQTDQVQDWFRQALGERPANAVLNLAAPKTASTSKDRAGAAADVATAAKLLGVRFVLKDCRLLEELQRVLIPGDIQDFLASAESDDEGAKTGDDNDNDDEGGVPTISNALKPSASAVSLSSMVNDEVTTITSAANSRGTDSKRGKTTPPEAREGALLILRALCEIVGDSRCEPYIVGALLAAALDECASSSGTIREAAKDTATAIVAHANPWAFPSVVCPLLLHALQRTTEWRCKAAALERIKQAAATTAPKQVHKLIPTLLPIVGAQVWDTKAQVSKSAKAALLAICHTNVNKDIEPAIGAIVNAICKPADTNKAVSELMGTTFVVPVDAATLAILCPILARALKEKLAIHKRAACLVISNMSKLVDTPESVAPFGSLLVPELQKVSRNVQFEEIRDEALKALANLTKALGDAYRLQEDEEKRDEREKEMAAEKARVEQEQERIRAEKEAEQKREEEMARKEAEERKKFKEAMEAQRQLAKLEAEEAARKKQEEDRKKEAAKLSTKGGTGKCQACGLKKCKKTCMFYDAAKK